MMDHVGASSLFGATSPQAILAREVYAAAMVDAASHGYHAPALEPLCQCARARHSSPLPLDDIFGEQHDDEMFYCGTGDVMLDIACVAGNTSPDIFTERQMRGPRWDEPKQLQIAKLRRLNAFTPIASDDPQIKGLKIVDSMWVGRHKRFPDGTPRSDDARCVLRGDIHGRTYNITANDSHSPVCRSNSNGMCDAESALRTQDILSFDVTGAYLFGGQRESERVLARAPVGFREFDERGYEILWWMNAPLYGQVDAGSIWNRTVNTTIAEVEPKLERSANDPYIYSRGFGPNETERVTLPLYVDDGRIYCDPTPVARKMRDAVRDKLTSKYEVRCGEINPKNDMFLGANREEIAPGVIKVHAESYIRRMEERFLPDGDSKYPAFWSYTPADESLVRAYEEAVSKRTPASVELTKRYQCLFGALLHVVKFRVEVAAPLGLSGTCLTFPTEEMYEALMRILVYLARTRKLGCTYSKHAPDAGTLRAFADSNWSTTRSTTGFCIMLASSAIVGVSRRQHCISMSSCEAELIALCDCAIELLHVSALLQFIGHVQNGPIEASTDNKGAYDLCHRFSSAQNSRHVDRKLFKMRELRGAGTVVVRHIPTEHNPADLFTKVLTRQPFEKHRKEVLNLTGDAAGSGAEAAKK